MYFLPWSVVFFLLFASVQCQTIRNAVNVSISDDHGNVYEHMLKDIHGERAFDTIMLVLDHYPQDSRLEDIYRFPKPKLVLRKDSAFNYKQKFNAEILVVILMSHTFDYELMELAARTLDFMRQVRTVISALDMLNQGVFKETALAMCHKYKMTNVLLNFVLSGEQMSRRYYQLLPYPVFHWHLRSMDHSTGLDYYPQHWWNMHNGTVITYTDQSVPRSLVFEDASGNLKLNGFVARLVLLFGERFNASLQMYKPLKVGEVTHFTVVNQLVEDNLVDIPMVMDVSGIGIKWIYRSYVYDIAQGILIVPCAQPQTIKEVFSILLNVYFFGSVIICTLVFSLKHSLIDYLFDGIFQPSNFIISDRILPGVLGQSFAARDSPWRALKLVYILLFFAGLNISTQFSVSMNTLFTSPPYHRQIETLEDIKHSSLKMTVLRRDVALMGGIMTPIARSVIFADNITLYEENRNNFNRSTGYYTPSTMWKILNFKQQYFSHRAFCTYDNMTIFRILPWTILLQKHSQYKEPLDYLIHRVHALGLMDAWHSSTFSDLLKLKKISLRDPNPEKGTAKALTVDDLHWVWMIVVFGLVASCAVFLAELWYKHNCQYSD